MSSNSLVSLAKVVIRKAAEIGLDEAGRYACGPAWPFAKKILMPVVEKLERTYPKLLLVPEEAAKAAEYLAKDVALQEMLHNGFESLESGQEEILAALARQDDTLKNIGDAINRGFLETGGKLEATFDIIRQELHALRLEVADHQDVAGRDVSLPPSVSELPASAIYSQSFAYQSDAMTWVVAGEANTASQRLAEARALLNSGLKREPHNLALLVSLGYVEKTQAQVAQLQSDHDEYVSSLAKAAKHFAAVLQRDPTDIGALNGMANVYLFGRDYDRAIELSTLAVQSDPNYGPAAWDLALALEGKLDEGGPNPTLVEYLKSVYRRLESIMPSQPQFMASNLTHVQKRLAALG